MRKTVKIIFLFVLVFSQFAFIASYTKANSISKPMENVKKFKDVKDHHWFKDDVELLTGKNIIDGIDEEYFGPDDTLLISHYIKMIVKAVGEIPEDSEGYWAKPYVDKALALGIIQADEYPDKASLEAPASRSEVAMITARAIEQIEGFDQNHEIYRHFIKDYNNIPEKYSDYVCRVYSKGIIQGYLDGRFAHDKLITRAEASSIIVRMLYPEKRLKAAYNQKGAKEISVLLYHHLLKESENTHGANASIISVENFEKQMDFLYQNNFNTITLKQLDDFLSGKTNLPEKSVLITFDDGYKSNYTYAYPIMKKYSFKGAVFLITGKNFSDNKIFNPAIFQFLSEDEISNSRDVFEYGSHTHKMHNTDPVKGSYLTWKTKEEIMADLESSRDFLNTRYLAYPFGKYNSNAVSILKEVGFKMAFTIKSGKVKQGDNMFELNRNIIYPNTTMEQFKKIVGAV